MKMPGPVGAVLIGASLIGPSLPTHISAEIGGIANIKIQGGLEDMLKSGNYPKYKGSSYVSVSIYYDNPISGNDIAALHGCKAQIPFDGINNQDRMINAGMPPSTLDIEKCSRNENVMFITPNYPQ